MDGWIRNKLKNSIVTNNVNKQTNKQTNNIQRKYGDGIQIFSYLPNQLLKKCYLKRVNTRVIKLITNTNNKQHLHKWTHC